MVPRRAPTSRGWMLLLLAVAGGCDERVVENPFPEGRDTVALVSEAVLVVPAGEAGRELVALDVDRAGRFVVSDAEGWVTVHEPDGTALGAGFGATLAERPRKDAPGAATVSPVVSAVGLLPGGAIAVREAGSGRVTVHDADGTVRSSWVATPGRPPYGRSALVVADDGSLYVGIGARFDAGGSGIRYPRPVFVRTGATGAALDTIVVDASVTEACPTPTEAHFAAGWFEDIRVRYVPKPQWAIGADGSLAVGCPASYAFDLARPDGSRLTVSRSYRPHATSEQEREDFVTVWTAQMNTSGVHDQAWHWRGRELPELKPAYGRILLAAGGRVWVWPARPSDAHQSPPDWPLAGLPDFIWSEGRTGAFDVFDSDGVLLGHVRLPERVPYTPYADTPDPIIRGDTVWAITVDPATGARGVERFRVDWGA